MCQPQSGIFKGLTSHVGPEVKSLLYIGLTFRHAIGLAFRLFRDASIRAAIMDARPKGLGGQTPEQYLVNVDPAKKSVP